MVYGSDVEPEVPEADPDQVTTPVPVPFTWMLPVVVAHAEGSFTVPKVITGVGDTVTVVGDEVAEHPLPSVTVTVYNPDVFAEIVCVVAPVDQMFPVAEEEVNVTEPPEQKVVGPLAVIVGVVGFAFTVTTVGADVAEHPERSV